MRDRAHSDDGPGLDLLVSPYHVTTREPALMASALLARRVVTMLPVPAGVEEGPDGRARLGAALDASPRYHRLLSAWAGLAPLWEAGVLATLHEGEADDPAGELAPQAQRIDRDGAWAPLRRFLHDQAVLTDDEALDLRSADLLKGGPDPGLALPVQAALDAFAVRHALVAVRAGGGSGRAQAHGSAGPRGSLAQQAEQHLGRTLLSVGVPIIAEGPAQALLRAREALAGAAGALGQALQGADAKGARAAAADYTRAFTGALPALQKPGGRLPRADLRVVPGFVSLQLRQLPARSTLLCALAALGRATGEPLGASAGGAGGVGNEAVGEGVLRTLVVTPMAVTLS
jgi:hypothetical protein